MKSNFRSELMLIMLAFSLILTITVSFVDQKRLQNKTVVDNAKEIQLVQDLTVATISGVEKDHDGVEGDKEKRIPDYMKVEKTLINKYDFINGVNVVTTNNKEAVVLGKTDKKGNAIKLDNEKQYLAFKAGTTRKIQELRGTGEEENIVYRYIPYSIGKKDDLNNNHVIELTYNEELLTKVLIDNQSVFFTQLIIILSVALFVSFGISRLISRPMYLAFNDELTGISNRASFENYLQDRLKRAKRKKNKRTAIMVIDLDNFKKVNDHLGHNAGDIVLKEVGRKIKLVLRNDGDMAARLGGDEFTVLLSDLKDNKNAEDVAKRILEELNRPIIISGVDVVEKFKITASIGISFIPDYADDRESAYRTADKAMYYAKQSGKNTYKIYTNELQIDGKK